MSTRLALLAPATTGLPSAWSAVDRAPDAQGLDWDEQMRRHGRRVIMALVARGIGLERAKELAQEAWMRVVQNHRAGKLEQLQLPGVVIAQAEFLARDDRRRTNRRQGFGMDIAVAVDPDAKAAPSDLEARLIARQELRRIRTVLENSSANARRVFAMTYGTQARPAADIAAELGISVQRVRQIACELRRRIRQELGGR